MGLLRSIGRAVGGVARGVGNAIGGVARTAGQLAPLAALIPGIGPVAAGAMGIAGRVLGGGGGGDVAAVSPSGQNSSFASRLGSAVPDAMSLYGTAAGAQMQDQGQQGRLRALQQVEQDYAARAPLRSQAIAALSGGPRAAPQLDSVFADPSNPFSRPVRAVSRTQGRG